MKTKNKNKKTSRNSLAKLIDKGWNITISNEAKSLSVMGIRTSCVRVVWQATKNDSKKGKTLESKWNGFETAKEAITDLLKKVK